MRITVKEVAAEAGVSKGTVDRVLHERGEVSEESRKRVLAAVEKLGYTPNLYASLLASKRHYKVICLMPQSRAGEYWDLVAAGIERARVKSAEYNVEVETIAYEQFNRSSFRTACQQVLDTEPDGVILAPMYRNETMNLCEYLSAVNIPYVFVDSRLEESEYIAYFGMPMHHSGYLGASLLIPDGHTGEVANIRIERGASPSDNPTISRREGFLEYIAQRAPETIIHNAFVRPYEPEYNEAVLDELFTAHPEIRLAIVFNSRVHLVAEYLAKHNIVDIELVGYDMLERNVQMLREGRVRFLIAQRTSLQVSRGVGALVDMLVFRRQPTERDNYMSMDILTRENIDFYNVEF